MGSSNREEGKMLRETVESLKEVVDCTEQEICAMLRECNMDPNEAVNRLLTQDTFHEVKSKREKKKELKGTVESRSQRACINNSARGVRGGADRVEYRATQANSYDSYIARPKPVQRKENGAISIPASSILGSGAIANNSSNCSVAPVSNNDAIVHTPGYSNHISLPSQPSLTLKHNWGIPGQPSMADIVKMGRPQRKIYEEVLPNASTTIPAEASQRLHSSEDNVINATKSNNEPSIEASQRQSLEEWILVDRPDKEPQVLLDVSVDSASHPEPLASYVNLCPHDESIQRLEEHVDGKNLSSESTISEGHEKADSFPGSYQQQEAENANEELSSATVNLHQVCSQKEEQEAEENSTVIIPGHLQVTNADCSHLSFGSFGSGVAASIPGDFSTKPANTNFDVTSVAQNSSSIDYSDSRNPDYYSTDELRKTSDVSVSPVSETSSRNYDVVLASQHEVVRDKSFIAEELQYNNPLVSNFAFPSTSLSTSAALNHAQSSSQMQSLASFSNLMPHTDSIPSNLLTGNARPPRESDVSLLHLLANQSMPTKYSPAMSSLSAPTISRTEAMKLELLSALQSNPQPTSSLSHPPHLSFPPYSQPTLPLGLVPNMFSYPLLPQSAAYMPFSGNSAFPRLPASLQSAGMRYSLPQYKSSMSLNGLPQSLPVGSGYGGYGGYGSYGSSGISSNIPLQNPSNISAGSSVGYEDALRSQYKETVPLPQSNNPALWLYGAGSRTQPSAASSTYYGHGLSQQGSNTHHDSSYVGGMMGYSNSYHSQLGGRSREHQQLPTHGSLNASQGQPSPSHWQQSY